MEDSPYQFSLRARLRIWAAPLILQAKDSLHDLSSDIPLLTRVASHLGLVILTMLVMASSAIQVNANDAAAVVENPTVEENVILVADAADNGYSSRVPNPLTDIPKRVRRSVEKYTVRPGDNVSDIAVRFEISPDSVLWANPKLEDNPDLISVGQTLNIPPTSGVLYTVQSGDTLHKIADKFKGKRRAEELVQNIQTSEFNQAHHEIGGAAPRLTVGDFIIVPGGTKPYIPRVVVAYSGPIPASAARGTGHFGWPVSGVVTQKYWTRHPGIDIGAPKGAPVYAADSGFVVTAGWNNAGFGYMVLVNHGNGFLTRYAHLSTLHVDIGESVRKGQLIGRVGSTGYSTGPHLHFEIIDRGGHRNPFVLLPGR